MPPLQALSETDLAVILVLAHALGALFDRLRQPALVGEILAIPARLP